MKVIILINYFSRLFLIFYLLFFVMLPSIYALPIGFLLQNPGNQKDVTWERIETPHFSIYYDKKSPNIGKTALNALENAYPDISFLLGVRLKNDNNSMANSNKYITSNFDKIPVVISTRAHTGGFADPITQKLELQVALGSNYSLFQHELVHRIMYEHLDANIGPAGRAFNITLMPTWWLEGLPEYLTESMGRTRILGVERTLAQYNNWLTWDSMHSLYNVQGNKMLQGYVLAGRFFKFLMDKSNITDLSTLHKDFFYRAITPPFVNVMQRMTSKYWQKSGPELFAEFKKTTTDFWKKHLQGVPEIKKMSEAKIITSSSGTPPPVFYGKYVLRSLLSNPPYSSSILVADTQTKRRWRLPLSIKGTRMFSMHPAEGFNGGFWTTRNIENEKGVYFDNLVYVKFKDNIINITDKKIIETIEIPSSTNDNQMNIMQIAATGAGNAFVLGNIRGDTSLYSVSVSDRKLKLLKSWASPVEVKLIPKQLTDKNVFLEPCISVMVDEDNEETSLSKVCTNNIEYPVLKPNVLLIKDGYERTDGTYILVVEWDKIQGIIQLIGETIKEISPIQEWVESIYPGSTTDEAAVWAYNGDHYNLREFSLSNLYKIYKDVLPNYSPSSPWKKLTSHQKYNPPYAILAAMQRKKSYIMHNYAGNAPKNSNSSIDDLFKPIPFEPVENKKIPLTKEEPAWRPTHLMTYPYPIIPQLGGWGIGIATVPWRDEMDRDRLEIYASYNANTKGINGVVQYVNNRLFDSFTLSTHSYERFNGFYSVCERNSGDYVYCSDDDKQVWKSVPGASKYTSLLREYGLSANSGFYFKTVPLNLNISTTIFRTSPESGIKSWVLGPQYANVFSPAATASYTLFEKGFYTDSKNSVDGDWLMWTTRVYGSGSQYWSLGEVKSGDSSTIHPRNQSKFKINYHKTNAGFTSSLALNNHVLNFRGNLGLTTGSGLFNLREIYQPYKTYLVGSGIGLNALNFGLLGDNNLFEYKQGFWVVNSTLDYSFPLITNIDKQFLIAYFDQLRGEIVLGRGGVSKTRKLDKFDLVTSASVAMRATIDIKGFQIWPSIAYGRIINNRGWSLFTEIAFSQFF